MKDRLRALLSTFIALSVLSLVILLYMHYSRRDSEKIAFTVDKGVGVEVQSVHFVAAKNGLAIWEMYADSAKRPKNNATTIFSNIRAVFREPGAPSYTLTADSGILNETGGTIDATGNVMMVSSDGDRLKTGPVRYTMKLGQAVSKERVELVSRGVRITGSGLLIDAGKNRLYIQSDVKAVISNGVI